MSLSKECIISKLFGFKHIYIIYLLELTAIGFLQNRIIYIYISTNRSNNMITVVKLKSKLN